MLCGVPISAWEKTMNSGAEAGKYTRAACGVCALAETTGNARFTISKHSAEESPLKPCMRIPVQRTAGSAEASFPRGSGSEVYFMSFFISFMRVLHFPIASLHISKPILLP